MHNPAIDCFKFGTALASGVESGHPVPREFRMRGDVHLRHIKLQFADAQGSGCGGGGVLRFHHVMDLSCL